MQSNMRLLFLGLLVAATTFFAACSEDLEDCDPAVDANCVCTLDADDTVVDDCVENETDDGEACTCSVEEGNNEVNNDGNNEVNNDGNNDGNNDAPEFRFVFLQDDTPNVAEGTPGADVDAIGLIKGDGSGEVFASNVEEESDVSCDGNDACDTNALTGVPDVVADGECFGGGGVDPTLFTSLNQGFVIVSFGDNIIENGDSVHVYEIGATECGRFDDDPYTVSVGVSDDANGTFIEIGSGAAGDNIIEVSGLE